MEVTQEEIEDLSAPQTSKDIESVSYLITKNKFIEIPPE